MHEPQPSGASPAIDSANARVAPTSSPRAGRWIGRCIRVFFWLTLAATVAFLAAIAATRFWLVPNADEFRPRIVEALSRLTQQRVVIGAFEAGWNGWSPEIKMKRLQILDPRGKMLLELPEVETTVSWRSLLLFEPRLSALTIRAPRVVIRRTAQNQLTVAGIDVDLDAKSEGDPAALEWLLRQRLVQVAGGELEWQDEWRGLPPLRLRDVNIRLFNDGSYHRIGMTATPSADIAAPIDFRSEFSGSNVRKISDWDGSAYVRVDYANIGNLARYLPLPIDIAKGEGGLQSWFEFVDGRAVAVTSDVVLKNAQVLIERPDAKRLAASAASAAPTSREALNVSAVSGRLAWRETAQNVKEKTSAQRWSLRDAVVTTLSGETSLPISGELKLNWRDDIVGSGELRASEFDLTIAQTIARSAPLPSGFAASLQSAAPQGRVRSMELTWQRPPDAPKSSLPNFKLGAEFDRFGVRVSDRFALSGVTGRVRATERDGVLEIATNAGAAIPSSGAMASVKSAIAGLTGNAAARTKPASQPSIAVPLLIDLGETLARPISIDSANGRLSWSRITPPPSAPVAAPAAGTAAPQVATTASQWSVQVEALALSNADLDTRIDGTWRSDELGPGIAKLTANFKRVNLPSVHKYLPTHLPEHTRTWVRDAVISGVASDGVASVNGALWHFPFAEDKHGVFELKAALNELELDYADRWPRALGIDGQIVFRGSSLSAQVARASISGVAIGPTQVRLPDMDSKNPLLEIRGSAAGSMDGFLRFVEKSPVNQMLDRFLENAKATGNAKLNLLLNIALGQAERTKLEGEFAFDGNRVELGTELPVMEAVSGKIRFTEADAKSRELTASALGGQMSVNVSTEAGHIRAQATGTADLARVKERYNYPFLDQLKGVATWALDTRYVTGARAPAAAPAVAASTAALREEPTSLRLTATLAPQTLPFDSVMQVGAQPRNAALPIAFSMIRTQLAAGQDQVEFELPGLLHTVLERSAEGAAGARTVERAVVNLGVQKTALPTRGYSIRGELAKLDVDEALSLLPSFTGSGAKNVGGVKTESNSADFVNVNLRADRVTVFSHVLNDATLRAQPSGQRWRLALRSKEATGVISIDNAVGGNEVDAVSVRLQKFSWPTPASAADRLGASLAVTTNPGNVASTSASKSPSSNKWPKLDLVAESFVSDGRELGRLEVRAQPAADLWRIESVKLVNADGSIDASGRWRVPAPGSAESLVGSTSVDVALKWTDAGRFMQRFGLPKGVERAAGDISGAISWPGSPAQFSYAALGGRFTLTTAGGRFTEMEPGLAKLLGVLSLQSLPRRLSFNFDDLFNRGFAFDTVNAEVSIASGSAKSEAFNIAGPAARVEIRGTADIVKETQNLQVRVFPSLTVATAVGIGLATANPAIGAAVLLGQKVARDPIERVLMQEFDITGNWATPEVKQTRGMGTPVAAPTKDGASSGTQ
ncbi:MAG: hypothetical protein EAZ43_12280 [Betaproteobacteria bacterium]|nr:MAG: hypothetical protein EAZ43_12280 [Betaproteobacteria bacterium]